METDSEQPVPEALAPRVTVFDAETAEHYRAARALFEEYAASLGFDLGFQGFREEVASLPGDYAPPAGALLLAECDGRRAGCVALRRLDRGTCEMKRLYVVPAERRYGVGRALAAAVIAKGRSLGYSRMRLDTVPSMKQARRLYESLGFREIEAYRFNPVPGAAFMELRLERKVSG